MNCDLTDNRELFSNKSDDYAKYRPSYPDAAVDRLKSEVPCGNVLDIGAGTGIFTAALLRRFKRFSAVDRMRNMRREFSGFLPGIVCSGGSGEGTGSPGNSFALITVAQAFNWLDAEKFKSEAVRILETHGKVAIVWNNSLNCDFTAERNRVCQKYCPRFRMLR